MNQQEVIARIQAALGPRMINCMGIGTAGSGHAVKRDDANLELIEEGKKPLFGVIWINDEQKALSKSNDFVWFLDIMPVHEGKLEDRPAEVQALPAQISIYTHDPSLFFGSLFGELFALWDSEKRFKTAQKWYHPGVYKKS